MNRSGVDFGDFFGDFVNAIYRLSKSVYTLIR